MIDTRVEELSNAAMKIILYAGDCRGSINDAINALCSNESTDVVEAKLEEAKRQITKAHIIQTESIQSAIAEDNQQTCLLFTHAQDTLMSINSELIIVKNMLRLYHKLESRCK